MADEPNTDPEAAARFLEWLRPGGPWVLSAKAMDSGRFETDTLRDLDTAGAWIAARNGRANIYVMINPARGPLASKAKKEDVEELAFLHVDMDVKTGDLPSGLAAIRSKLEVFAPRPSGVIFSGGGYWGFWRLAPGETLYLAGDNIRITDAEAYNRGLERVLDADNCHNVDRICRLPGTINLPDDGKRKRGREAAASSIVWLEDGAHALRDFMPVYDDAQRAGSGRERVGTAKADRPDVVKLNDPAELEKWLVPPWARAVIVEGTDPTDPDRWGGDRSAAQWAVTCELARRKVPPGLIVGILTDKTWGISAHVLDQKRSLEYAWKQVEKAIGLAETEGEPFEVDKHGLPYPNQRNIRLALTKMGVRVRYDRFADRAALNGLDGFGPHLSDAALTRMRLRIEEQFKLKVGKETFCDVVEDAARRDDFHPVVDYLDALAWDGTPRLDGWMTAYMQADDTDYTRHVGTIMLIAAVRRVRQPGCKFDEMVVLESEQGKAKSSALAVLAVNEDWFSDDLPLNAEAKLVIERTQGRWIIEAGELKGMSPKGVEHLKGFLSRRRDSSRMAYGRLTHDAPRHFIVVGTTNDDKYLVDNTGNRRFWPVRVGDIDLDALARDRDQLWAEAASREAADESIRLDRALWQAAALEQDERRTIDPFVAPLADLFRGLQGKVRSADVWQVIGTPLGQRTPEQERRLGAAMRDLGFERTQARFGGDPEHCYRRGNADERKRRILTVCVPGENGIGGAWEAYLEGDDLPGRQDALDLERRAGGDQPY